MHYTIMAKKHAQCGEYLLIVEDSGSITTLRLFENTKGAMREMCETAGVDYDNAWTTRQFGNKLFNEHVGNKVFDNLVTIGEYTLQRLESGSYKMLRQYNNVKGVLREISAELGFNYDPKWNTRQFGSKLVDFINEQHD